MKLSPNNKIEPLIVTAVSLLARASHLLFFFIIGNKYGASVATDFIIYLIAPLTVISSVASGAADAVVMPVFHKVEDNSIAKYLFIFSIKKIFKFIFPLSLIVILISSFFAQSYDFLIMAILLPIPLFSALGSLKTGVLNASNKFRVAMLGPFFGSLFAIFLILLAPTNIYYFGLSFLVFEIGKFVGISLFRDITSGSSPLHNKNGDKIISWGIKNAKWQLAGSFILSLSFPVDIWFSSTLDSGSATFVEYANKLWNIVPLLFVGHITIIYAEFSKASVKGVKLTNIHGIAIKYLFLGIFVSLFIFPVSDFIIRMLYGFGKMNVQQQTALSDLLKSYLIGAGPYVGGLVYVRAMSAYGRTDLLFVVASIGLLCNILFDALFIRMVGLNGIGLATSAAYLCTFFLLAYFCYENEKNRN